MKFIAPIVTIAISVSCMIATSNVLAVNSNRVRRNVLRGRVERDLRIRILEPSGEGEEESESLSDSLSDSLSESEDESESLDSIEEEATGESLVEVDSGEATGDETVQELKLLDLESGTSGISGIGVTDGEDEEEDGTESVSEDESESLSDSLSESEDESESLDSIEEEGTADSLVQVDSGEATIGDSSTQMNLLDLENEIDELQSEITNLESEITNTSGIVGTDENGAESESEDDGESESLSESEDESVSLDITDEEGNSDGTLVRVIAGRVSRPSSARVNLLRFDSVTTNMTTNTSDIGVESENENEDEDEDEDEDESSSESDDESQSSDEEGNRDGVAQMNGVDLVQMNLLDYQSRANNLSGNGLASAFIGILITGLFHLI